MRTYIILNYFKYYNIYHLGIFYATVIIINLFLGIVPTTTECEPPELKPYVGDPDFVPNDDIKRDGLIQGVYASGYVEKPAVNYVKPMVDTSYHTPKSHWPIEYKVKLLGEYIISWFSLEAWYQWYNQDSILAQQANQVRKVIETTPASTNEANIPEKIEVLQKSNNLMTEELEDCFNKILNGLININESSLSNTIPSEEIREKILALLPQIDINTDNYDDMKLNTTGKYHTILNGINTYGVENKIMLIKHLMVQYNLNCFIYTLLKEKGIMLNEDQCNNMYMFLLDQYTEKYGF